MKSRSIFCLILALALVASSTVQAGYSIEEGQSYLYCFMLDAYRCKFKTLPIKGGSWTRQLPTAETLLLL